jgi:hypothetical protein
MMRKLLPLFFGLVLFLSFAFLNSAFAQKTLLKGSLKTTVQATVGEFSLSICGYIAPNASIVETIDGVFARATVADQNGDFCVTDVLIKRGASKICLDAIDFKRIGESIACFSIPPAQASITMKDVFLPPTLGLSRNEVAEGASVKAYGYSMPGALVTLYLSNGKVLTTYADPTGYYEFTISGLKAGSYSLYAKAQFNHKQSLDPTNRLKLRSLSWWDQLIAFIKDLWNKFLKFLKDLALGPLWLVIPILISIIILLVKLVPGRFGFLRNPLKKKKPLHHKWWMGY